MNNSMIPLLQMSIYIIIGIMVCLVGAYVCLLSPKRSKNKQNSEEKKTDIQYDNMELNDNDEDDPIRKM